MWREGDVTLYNDYEYTLGRCPKGVLMVIDKDDDYNLQPILPRDRPRTECRLLYPGK